MSGSICPKTYYGKLYLALQCPDSSSKKDLLAYLQRIALYCHQLNITSKVKADVQSVSGELIVSGVSGDFTFLMVKWWILPHLLIAGCNIGVKLSICQAVRL